MYGATAAFPDPASEIPSGQWIGDQRPAVIRLPLEELSLPLPPIGVTLRSLSHSSVRRSLSHRVGVGILISLQLSSRILSLAESAGQYDW